MATAQKDPVFVVLQLSGGNDYMNTVIPYTDSMYWDYRPKVKIPEEEILPLDDAMGLHPEMGPIKEMYDGGDVAIIHGVGYENSPRSHFRSMDIWHTCEPDDLGTEGWLGRAIRDIDPNKENVVTGVSFGPSMFRAMALPGVPVATVDDLDNYGLLTRISDRQQRDRLLERYKRLYGPAIGTGRVMEFLGQTGLDALKGAEVLSVAPDRYSSSVEYADNTIARKLKGIAQIHTADLGTRVFYCDHDAADNVIMLLFSEFGRRTHDNGSGTDHGAAGAALVIGDAVAGGQYSEYPSTRREDLQQGDLVPNTDFRGLYSTILEDWMGLDAKPIVEGTFEKPAFIASA